jgi:hypothetical protein
VTVELRDLHTPLHSDEYMDDIYNNPLWFDHWNEQLMIGAGWTNHTTCVGDSGGPLTVTRNGVTVQVGVVSLGPAHWYNGEEECNEPGGFAELSGPQLAWVAATVPGVAARWGSCTRSLRRGLIGTALPGRWVATYSQGYDDVEIVEPESWSFSCVPAEPVPTLGGSTPRATFGIGSVLPSRRSAY